MFWVTILFYGPCFDSVMLSSLPNAVCWLEWVREFVSLGVACIRKYLWSDYLSYELNVIGTDTGSFAFFFLSDV
jgi:hypothetical protein